MRSIITINLNQLKANYSLLSNYLNKPIFAVVKSNAYGHGIIQITKSLAELGVKTFFVATIEEALMLRKYFNNISIVLLEQCTNFQTMYTNRIIPSVGTMSYLRKIISSNLSFPIQLKLETGLNRLGITNEEIIDTIKLINKSRISIKGIYTHISSKETYFNQLSNFKKMIIQFENKDSLQIHINSSNYLIKDNISTHYRIGLALYGLIKHSYLNLEPILSLKSPIYRIKKVKQGDKIGYHQSGIVKKDGYIVTIPLGYADGWIKNRKTVGYHQGYLNQIGETCMDLMMFYSPNYISEDEFIEIISPNVSIFDLCAYYNESPYEIVTMLSPRIEKKYIKE
ncbi:MAG: alanine racemase [Bacillales bacterium]|nr:alanine racemase [Bacillales bacterium]